MKESILAIRRQEALERIEYAFQALSAGLGSDLQQPVIPIVANRDPAVKHMLTLEGIAERLETVAREIAPDYMPSLNVSPTALELAEQEGVDLTKVEGTGVEGRILKSDVLGAVDVQALEREEAEKAEALAKAEANATPAALRYANEHGIDLLLVEGTGTEGRITLDDVKGLDVDTD